MTQAAANSSAAHPQIEEALEKVQENYGGQLDACERLLNFTLGLLTPWHGRPIEKATDGLLAALFARTTNTFWSAFELGRIGFGEQAAMLNRSLFEDMVDLHWIVDNPDVAIERYEQHNGHAAMLLADALEKHPGFFPVDELPVHDAEDRRKLDALFGPHGHKSWTSEPLYRRVNGIEHHWGEDDANLEHLRFFRDIVHRENNQLLHVSAHSLNQVVRRSGPSEGGMALKLGPGYEYLERSFLGSFWIYGQSVSLVLEWFEFDESAAAGELFQELMSQFYVLSDDEIRSVGRNDPCPCGSGKKFKRCHGK